MLLLRAISALRRSFIADCRGGVMLIFSITILLLLGVGGLALDYSRAIAVKEHAQNALDSAVLAATDSLVPNKEKQERFSKIFNSNFHEARAKIRSLSYAFVPGNGGKAQANLWVNTYLMGVLGLDVLDMRVESAANQENNDIEIALVLDVSGSMQNSMGGGDRLDALKDAANRLIELLEENKGPNQSIKYAVVPFTMNVNIGKTRANYVDGVNHPLYAGTEWKGCVLERPAPYTNADTYNNGRAPDGGKWHAYIWPPEPNNDQQCANPSNGTNTGYQSVQDNLAVDPTYSATKGPNYNCVRQSIMPLIEDAGAARTKIDELVSHNNEGTIIAPGVAWAHRVLSPEEPFSEGKPFSNGLHKVMVVITDGEQTTEGPRNAGCKQSTNTISEYRFDPSDFGLAGSPLTTTGPRDTFSPYGYLFDSGGLGSVAGWGNVDDQLDKLALDACAQFKSRGASTEQAEIYTVAASEDAAPGTRVYNTLQACASSADHIFYANNADALTKAFEKIARNTAGLRLTQ